MIPICFLPTPIHPLKRLSTALDGPEIWIKRDDLTGLAMGGNKSRKLEFLLAEAMTNHCDTIITGGASQSNHCRQTAAASNMLGLSCHLVLGGSKPEQPNGNLLIDELLGAQIHWAGEHRKGEHLSEISESLRLQGKKPYVIPYGGSNPTGAMGFVKAFEEFKQQCEELNLKFDRIVFASSSGGTHAGLLAGKILYNKDIIIHGVSIDKDEPHEIPFKQRIHELTEATLSKLNCSGNLSETDIILDNSFSHSGYGNITTHEKEAIKLLARTEGVLVDPIYTARALAALIKNIKLSFFKPTERILFWHTGGHPAIFEYANLL